MEIIFLKKESNSITKKLNKNGLKDEIEEKIEVEDN